MIDRRNEEGFTLIELMVVIVIIGILIALIIPNMTKQADRAKEKRAIAEITLMKSVLDAYYIENGKYPTDSDDAAADETDIESVLDKNGIDWGNDPWGQAYVYFTNEDQCRYYIYSKGEDSEGGNCILASETKKPQTAKEESMDFTQEVSVN